jgi:hypothetical protein
VISTAFAEALQAVSLEVEAVQSASLVPLGRLLELLPNMANSAETGEQGEFAMVKGVLMLMADQPGAAFDDLADALDTHAGVGLSRPLNLLAHSAAWSRDIGRVRRALMLPQGRPWKGRVFDTMVRHLHATATVLTDAGSGASLAAVADDLTDLDLLFDSSMTWAELALLTTDFNLARDADQKARAGMAAMGAEGLLKLYERSLPLKGVEISPGLSTELP